MIRVTAVRAPSDETRDMQQTRVPTRIWASFELAAWKGEGTIENIAPGGLFVGTATIPDRGEKVWLCFETPTGEPVEASGVVWWTTLDRGLLRSARRSGFGVRLVGASRAYRKLFPAARA